MARSDFPPKNMQMHVEVVQGSKAYPELTKEHDLREGRAEARLNKGKRRHEVASACETKGSDACFPGMDKVVGTFEHIVRFHPVKFARHASAPQLPLKPRGSGGGVSGHPGHETAQLPPMRLIWRGRII
eukprot:6205636-Pleurochrysis_carterae.AAC.5